MSFRAIPSTVACILTSGLAALPAPAQSLIPRDGLATDGHLVAYDTARHRLVTLGRQGETRELDGTHWRLRPGTGPSMFGVLAYRAASRRTLAFGAGYDSTAQTWEFDGVAWQQLSPPVQPTPRERFGCAYDTWRDRVVVFSGLSWTGTAVTDTWEWDGTNWSQRATSGPTARQDAGMAFDAARGRCVLFGGQSALGPQGDTWEWNGTVWTRRLPATSPPPRSGAPLAYDAARARIVLHGGFALGPVVGVSDEVWEYGGSNWQLVGSGGPGGQMRHDLVYDPDRGAVLTVSNPNNGPSGLDYWSWDGAQWTRALTVPYQPTWGYGVRATAEPRSGGILAYGGSTMIFSGGVWTPVATTGAPPQRVQVGMWSDGASAWMFGGRDIISGPRYGDTLLWNGSAWVSTNPAASPSPRSSPGIAYDPIAGHAVLFGGFGTSGTGLLGDTWLFDGTVWQPVVTPIAPPARGSHGLAFDPVRNCIVLFGGTGANPRNDTWEWNGTAWSAIGTARRPPAYGVAALAFDLRGNRMVATMAPFANLALPNFGEVWSYDGLDWTQVPLAEPSRLFQEHSLVAVPGSARLFAIDGTAALELVDVSPRTEVLGTPCPAAAPGLVARALPEPGNQEFGIDVVQGPVNGFVLLAGSLQSTTLPVGSCTLWLGAPLVAVVLAANAAGFVSQPIPVPPQAALVGGRLWFQVATAPLVPPNSITLSAALQVEIGG